MLLYCTVPSQTDICLECFNLDSCREWDSLDKMAFSNSRILGKANTENPMKHLQRQLRHLRMFIGLQVVFIQSV